MGILHIFYSITLTLNFNTDLRKGVLSDCFINHLSCYWLLSND